MKREEEEESDPSHPMNWPKRVRGKRRNRRELAAESLAAAPLLIFFFSQPLFPPFPPYLFTRHNNLNKQTVMRDRVTRNSRGFGFVTVVNSEEADAAAAASPHAVDGARVDAKESVPSEPRRDGFGGGGGENAGGGGGGEPGGIPSMAAQNRAKKVFVGGLPSATSTGKFFFFFFFSKNSLFSLSLGRCRSRKKKEKKQALTSLFFLYYRIKTLTNLLQPSSASTSGSSAPSRTRRSWSTT